MRKIKNLLKKTLYAVVPRNYIIWRGKRNSNKVALTFDDGPDIKYTPQVLDILKKYKIKATFFLVGKNIEQCPHLVKRMADEKHEIGNHTYSHRDFKNTSWNKIEEEIMLTQEVIKNTLGTASLLFRPPRGRRTLPLLLYSLLKKMTTVFWTIDPNDYCSSDMQDILERVNKLPIYGGEIILLHDKNKHTLSALPKIIGYLMAKNMELVTVSELLNE